ncbi:MAG: hypothetical protein JXR05_10590 [Flavobacteriaceae bacterium]
MTSVDDIKELLQKNKKILGKELQQSKEAMSLIKKSTYSTLTEEEKEKVKVQMLDICKAIPAFAIFMLPGGALLLPLLIKLIPDILPTSFRDDEEAPVNNE